MADRKPFVDVGGRWQELPSGDALVDGDGNPIGGGGGTPAGNTGEVQYNDNGAFGASSTFVYSGGKLGVGVASPGAFIHALGTTQQARFGYDAGKYISFAVSSIGNVTLTGVTDSTGGDWQLTPKTGKNFTVTTSGSVRLNGGLVDFGSAVVARVDTTNKRLFVGEATLGLPTDYVGVMSNDITKANFAAYYNGLDAYFRMGFIDVNGDGLTIAGGFESAGQMIFKSVAGGLAFSDESNTLLAMDAVIGITLSPVTDQNVSIALSGTGSAVIGDGTNCFKISSTGAVTLTGTAKITHHQQIPVTAALVSGSSVAVYGTTCVAGMLANQNTDTFYFQWELYTGWDGADIYVEVDWLPATDITNGQTVIWNLAYRSIAEGEDVDSFTDKTLTLTYTSSGTTSAGKVIHSRFTLAFNDSTAPLTAEDHTFFKVNRSATADTYGGDCIITAFEIIWTANSLTRA